MKTIVSTKVLSQEQKAILSVLPIHLIEHNFITVSPITMSLTPPYDLLIVTSQNAVKSLSQHPLATTLKETPVLCVGEQTQQLLTQNGFNVLYFAHYASDLVQHLQQNLTSLKKLTSIAFFAGTQRLNTLPNFFVENNLKVKEITAYKTEYTPIEIKENASAILFYSPSGVESYCTRNALTAEQQIFCIGKTTAEAVKNRLKKQTENIILPPIPTVKSLLEILSIKLK